MDEYSDNGVRYCDSALPEGAGGALQGMVVL